MNSDEFYKIISQDPNLIKTLQNISSSISPTRKTRGVLKDTAEFTTIVALFPIVIFVVKEIGLPWLYEVKRYSELWREKFHDWVDQQYYKYGRDPEVVKSTGEILRKELEKIVDKNVRKSWECLANKLELNNHNNSED